MVLRILERVDDPYLDPYLDCMSSLMEEKRDMVEFIDRCTESIVAPVVRAIRRTSVRRLSKLFMLDSSRFNP